MKNETPSIPLKRLELDIENHESSAGFLVNLANAMVENGLTPDELGNILGRMANSEAQRYDYEASFAPTVSSFIGEGTNAYELKTAANLRALANLLLGE